MGKGILIVVIGAILTLNVMTLNNNNRLTKATEVAEESFSKSKAKRCMSRLSNESNDPKKRSRKNNQTRNQRCI